MSELSGKHALVTGAGRGIGAAIAERLARDGADVTLLGRTEATLASTAQAIRDALPSCAVRVVVCDVTDAARFQEALATLPRVDILINNAGQAMSAPVTRTDDALWSQMLAVNLTAPFACTRAVLPAMVAAQWGRIVNVASTAALRGYPYVAAYSAAKHGVVGFTRSLAHEVAARGVTVNAVCPGFTETDMLDASIANIVERTGRTVEDARATLANLNPQRRFITPQDVAHVVSGLCSPAAGALTGLALPVSGGEVM